MLCNINDLARTTSSTKSVRLVACSIDPMSYAKKHTCHAKIGVAFVPHPWYSIPIMKKGNAPMQPTDDRYTDRFVLNDLLDDLQSWQLANLLNWLWLNQHITTRANIRAWRKAQGLNS